MARPDFSVDLLNGTFKFDNGHVTIEGQTVGPPLTVQSVTLTNHHHEDGLALGISGVEVPSHLFDLLI
jgi:hypothetical protein